MENIYEVALYGANMVSFRSTLVQIDTMLQMQVECHTGFTSISWYNLDYSVNLLLDFSSVFVEWSKARKFHVCRFWSQIGSPGDPDGGGLARLDFNFNFDSIIYDLALWNVSEPHTIALLQGSENTTTAEACMRADLLSRTTSVTSSTYGISTLV